MKSFYRYLIPSLISSVLISMYVIIDGIFVGQKIGDAGLVAINIIWPLTAFLQGIGLALGLSGGIIISTLNGKKEEEKANKVKLTTILIIVFLGIILGLLFYVFRTPLIWLLGASDAVFDYANEYLKVILAGSVFQMLGIGMVPLLKNSGKVKLAMTASISSILVNLVLDYVFLYPMNMALKGAALASVIAQIVSFLICLVAYYKEFTGVIFEKVIIKNLMIGVLAPFILNYSYSLIIIMTNITAMKYGNEEAVAAYTLLSYILYVIGAVAQAVGDSVQPLFSYNEAINDRKSNYLMLNKCILISFVICFIGSLLIVIFNNQLGELYNLSNKAFIHYQDGLLYYIIGFILLSITKVISSYLYAVDDKKKANLVILIEPFILTPILLFGLSYLFNVYGVWVSYCAVQAILVLLSIIVIYYKIKKEKLT